MKAAKLISAILLLSSTAFANDCLMKKTASGFELSVNKKISKFKNLSALVNAKNKLVASGSCVERQNIQDCSIHHEAGTFNLSIKDRLSNKQINRSFSNSDVAVKEMSLLVENNICRDAQVAQPCDIQRSVDGFNLKTTYKNSNSSFVVESLEKAVSLRNKLVKSNLCVVAQTAENCEIQRTEFAQYELNMSGSLQKSFNYSSLTAAVQEKEQMVKLGMCKDVQTTNDCKIEENSSAQYELTISGRMPAGFGYANKQAVEAAKQELVKAKICKSNSASESVASTMTGSVRN